MAETEKRRYRVYVIRLRNSVWEMSAKFRKANPHYDPGRPHVYVGSTSHTAEQRFEKHLSGGQGTNRLVTRFGKRLFESEYGHLPTFDTRLEAEASEREIAEGYRARGWGVWYNADPVRIRRKRER